MSSTSPAEGPYTAEPSVIKEGMFQVRNAEGEPVMTICGLDEARDRASALNSAYLAGQASREQSPDMVDRVIRICKETLNAHGYDFPLDHDTPAMLDFRTHLTSLFKPQP